MSHKNMRWSGMSYGEQPHQFRVGFDKRAKARRHTAEQQFQELRDAQEEQAEEAERAFAETDEGEAQAAW